MASRRSSFFSKPSHIFPTTSESETRSTDELEFDEADMWNMSYESDTKKGSKSGLKRGSNKKVEPCGSVSGGKSVTAQSSLPMNVPDWSKILKEDYKKRGNDIIEDFDDGSLRVPPHEYLARTREASHSVHEGRGRTLKGRDLRSVRNAIWKKFGFED
ncbi:hypothetical protein TanjilG_18734 [Lupinus angustifolius]|uniref:Senescence regulator n=1 Tax=Lupinus angustifolius TaxID=3871 RepID=A0A1J7GVJ6_LUPAN|nr:PREDICTED: uncharacterized protein LOC109333793 [Lupinus angustifolius]OIV92162.1 hypothetical protein TanjilG_18734 [Lupinus angustifolius]